MRADSDPVFQQETAKFSKREALSNRTRQISVFSPFGLSCDPTRWAGQIQLAAIVFSTSAIEWPVRSFGISPTRTAESALW